MNKLTTTELGNFTEGQVFYKVNPYGYRDINNVEVEQCVVISTHGEVMYVKLGLGDEKYISKEYIGDFVCGKYKGCFLTEQEAQEYKQQLASDEKAIAALKDHKDECDFWFDWANEIDWYGDCE